MRVIDRHDQIDIDDAIVASSVIFWVGIIIYAVTRGIPEGQYGILFLGAASFIYTLNELSNSTEKLDRALLIISSIIIIITIAYLTINYDALYTERVGYATTLDYIVALGITSVIIYLTYHNFGIPFVTVIVTALAYAYLGPIIPGFFGHTGISVTRLLQVLVTDIEGLFGSLNRIMATWIVLFLLYSGLLQSYGAFDLILRIALRTSEYIKSGVAQSAVIASLIIGSVNGSSVANTGITGSLTIPLMKENGLESDTAGGIEAVASTGGQIMPPIMGTAAFLMASILGRAYVDILIAGIVPALIFYLSVIVAVHFAFLRDVDLDVASEKTHFEKQLSRREFLTTSLKYLIPFGVLIYFLVIAQFTIMTAGLYTVGAMIISGILFDIAVQPDLETLLSSFQKTVSGMRIGAITTAPIAIIISSINGIVDLFVVTGMPSKLSLALMELSGGVLLYALVLAFIICVIMGLGMPTSAAYLVVAVLIAPTLVNQFAVPELAAHYFVMYAAILSAVTPPIATGVAVASGIAGAGFWHTANKALRIAAPMFVLPFMFVFHPEIINPNINIATIVAGGIGLVGAIGIVYAFNHVDFSQNRFLDILIRLFIASVGILIMGHPEQRYQLVLIGAILLSFIVTSNYNLPYIGKYIS